MLAEAMIFAALVMAAGAIFTTVFCIFILLINDSDGGKS
jgi:hypothetical protein